MRAAYKPDLAIGIGWGMNVQPALDGDARTFDESWATSFPDPGASWHFIDFLYHGTLVERQSYVTVDARCNLPLPRREVDGEGADAEVTGLVITSWQRDFFRVLNALETSVDYDDYLRRAGFQVEPR